MSELVTWTIDPAAYMAAVVQNRIDAIEQDVVALIDGLTEQVTAYMQANARWTDRTGDARRGLWSDIDHVVHQAVYLLMSHDVTLDYSWYLETVSSGRYEILSSTSDHFWPVLYRGVLEILRRHSS